MVALKKFHINSYLIYSFPCSGSDKFFFRHFERLARQLLKDARYITICRSPSLWQSRSEPLFIYCGAYDTAALSSSSVRSWFRCMNFHEIFIYLRLWNFFWPSNNFSNVKMFFWELKNFYIIDIESHSRSYPPGNESAPCMNSINALLPNTHSDYLSLLFSSDLQIGWITRLSFFNNFDAGNWTYDLQLPLQFNRQTLHCYIAATVTPSL